MISVLANLLLRYFFAHLWAEVKIHPYIFLFCNKSSICNDPFTLEVYLLPLEIA